MILKQTQQKKQTTRRNRLHESHEKATRELSAGGVVFKRTQKGVSFAMMKDPFGKWTFPKGRVEKFEDLEEAAARETLEELGLEEIKLLDYLGRIDIWFRDKFEKKGQLIHKDIHFFLFETSCDSGLYPDPKEHAYEAKWVPIEDVVEISSYSDMVPIVGAALESVKKIIR